MQERTIAEQVVRGLGGAGNIVEVECCMTRLRVRVAELARVDVPAIKGIQGVIDVLTDGPLFQVVLGPGTAQGVVEAIAHMPDIKVKVVQDDAGAASTEKTGGWRGLFRVFGEVFTPLIPALIGSGLVAGFTKLLQSLGVRATLPFMNVLNVVGFAFFGYIIIFAAMNTAKVCGGSAILGAVAGCIMVNPSLSSLNMVAGRGGVIGAMLAGWLIATIEKAVRKASPGPLKVHLPPTAAIFIAGLVIVYVLQPVGGFVADSLVKGVVGLLKTGGVFAGAIIAALFLPLVMTGLHHGLTPINLELIKTVGYTQIQTLNSMAGAGQVGAALALWLRYRDRKGFTSTIKGGLPVGVLGIGEPLIYGVTLPLWRPFITACLGAAAGGVYVMATGLGARGVYVSGVLGIVIATNPVNYAVAYLIAAVCGFALTYFIGAPENLVADLDRQAAR